MGHSGKGITIENNKEIIGYCWILPYLDKQTPKEHFITQEWNKTKDFVCLLVFDTIKLFCVIVCIWIITAISSIFGLESNYFIKMLNQIAESGYTIIFLFLLSDAIYVIWKRHKKHE